MTEFNVAYLDSLERAGTTLAAAVDELPNDYLRALGDRLDLGLNQSMTQLRIVVKRRLVGAGGSLHAGARRE